MTQTASEHIDATAARGELAGSGDVGARVVAPFLVGRTAELEALLSAVTGPPAVVTVEGEAGIGKSRLVAELVARSSADGRRALTGRCHGIREPFPLGAVVEALQGLADDLLVLELSPLTGVLRPLLPELAQGLPEAVAPLGDPGAERHRVFRALAELLAAAVPAVVVLEDLHWADEQTVEFLTFLVAAQPAGLSLVMTYREEEASEAVRGIAARLPTSTTVVRVGLTGLDTGEVATLAAAILETDRVSDGFATYLRERTDGVPFALEEVLALLRERGDLVRTGGGWSRRALTELGVPRGVRDSVLERSARLGRDAQAVVEAAAVLQPAASQPVLTAVAGIAADRAVAAVSEAVRSGLVQERDGMVGFRHDLAAEAVYEALLQTRRRDLHGRAADALSGLERPPLGQLAHHLRRAGRMREWARVAEQAADQAVATGNDSEAARLLRDVLARASLDPLEGRVRVARKLGRAALHGMAQREALKLLLSILDDEGLPRGARGELRLEVALLLDQAGDQVACYRQLEQAVPELEGHPAKQARAMAALAPPNVPEVPVAEHLTWMRRSMAALAGVDDPVVETAVQRNRAALLLEVGDPAWRESLAWLEAEPRTPAHERALTEAKQSLATNVCNAGFCRLAESLLAKGLAVAEREGYERERLMLESVGITLDFNLGRWEGLDEAAGALGDRLGALPRHVVEVELVVGCLALARGDLDRALDRLQRTTDLAEHFVTFQSLALAAGALARLELLCGDPRKATDAGLRAVAMLEPKGMVMAAGPAIRWAAAGLTSTGQHDEAVALVSRLADTLDGRNAPRAAAALHASRGVLAEAGGHPAQAAGFFLEAAQAYAALPCPYESAQAYEEAAVSLFAGGDHRAAETLQVALDVYERLGASWDLARATRIARQQGMSVPARHRGGRRGYGDALSPREREVAELAATGLTNKEIAHELFLSPTTVNSHLARARRKLGVRSRAAVAGRLAEQASNEQP